MERPKPKDAMTTRALSIVAREILLDLDGTLVSSISAVEEAWALWAEHWAIPRDSIPDFHGKPARATLALLVRPDQVEKGLADLKRFETQTSAQVQPTPGALSLLSSLPLPRWAVVTSANREVATERMRVADIPTPHRLVSSDDVTRGKPDPDPFVLAMTSPKGPNDLILALEDAPVGLQSARGAGCFTVGVVGTYSAVELAPNADIVIGSLEEIRVVRELSDAVELEIVAFSERS